LSKNLADALRGKSGWVTFDVESREAVSELSIAKTLRRYHIRPGTVRIGAEVGKGYKWEDVLGALEHYVAKSEIGRKITELKEMSNLADEAAKEQDKQKEREGKRLAKVVAGAAKIAGQEAANAFEVTLQRAKDEKAAEEMELEEKDFKQELSDFARWSGFMVGADSRFFSRAAALRLAFRPPWIWDKASL
jgi:hypothetical protein